MKTIKIYSLGMQKYLEENGLEPLYEDYRGEVAVYEKSKKLLELLDSYSIRYLILPNRR